jgi:2-polyprenyl-3-methyl-5-hydroxy-6-metoxy-1,4-benzoquinol methylase
VTLRMDTSAVANVAREFTARGEWPAADLEVLGRCPCCESEVRSLMFSGLRDFAFAVAAGEWNMWQCGSCTAAYLDPQPSASSIGRAYSRYYTHQGADATKGKIRILTAIKHWLGSRIMNDYKNHVYGYRFPAVPFGTVISGLWPTRRRRVEHSIRHLPAPKSADSALLDVGCGNGDFVKVAASLGFRALGVDADNQAVIAARSGGLDVRKGRFPGSGLAPESFEHITANHVLEHLRRPKEAIRELYELLQPGGRLWLSQPNLGAVGLKEFGAYWRGLEPPRHMTLFDSDGMRCLLESCGFVKVRLLPSQPVASFYYRQSQCQVRGVDPYARGEPPGWGQEWERRARDADARAQVDPRLGESLTMIAWKSQ